MAGLPDAVRPDFANATGWPSIFPTAEIASPDHERPGIMLPENAFADDEDTEPLVKRRRDLPFNHSIRCRR